MDLPENPPLQLCECVAGGLCDKRGIHVQHAVSVLYARDDDRRETGIIASPAMLDQWLADGEIVYAECTATCNDHVLKCPAIGPYLRSVLWDEDGRGRKHIRDHVRLILDVVDGDLVPFIGGLRHLKSVYGTDIERNRWDINPCCTENAPPTFLALHEAWDTDAIKLADIHYWLRVLERFRS
ncbi:hypothetical protein [Saccharothrix sp. ALI-22-I]|uniref:hypothetical protein n=1 Tax=Saccharothrix sp. ALI-22-I TaxID=1933778 RepID=UPI00117B9596|nr:hypothetical protein [Saccharothrix sp. ALI-22-I]